MKITIKRMRIIPIEKKRMKSQKNQNGSKPNGITMHVPFRKEKDTETNQMALWNNDFDH
jgi:hypothetical protein